MKQIEMRDMKHPQHVPSYFMSMWCFFFGKFLDLDDDVVEGLLNRQMNEHTNIALVSALVMTITFSYMPTASTWGEETWVVGAFSFAVSCCNSLITCAVSLSTAMILMLNCLKNDMEAREYVKLIGKFDIVPFQCLWFGICIFGFCVSLLLFYKVTNYDNWFYYIIGFTYSPAIIILPMTASVYVRKLYEIKRHPYKTRVLVLDVDKVKSEFASYITDKFDGDAERVPSTGTEFEEFLEVIRKKHDAEYVGRLTKSRMKTHYDEQLGKLMNDSP